MKSMLLVAILAGLVLIAASDCNAEIKTGVKPLSPGAFVGDCMADKSDEICDRSQSICQAYEDILMRVHADAEACRAECLKASQGMSSQDATSACSGAVNNGASLCAQQCLRLYPAQ